MHFSTHRRAESDSEEHVYEDPASLRRSGSDRAGLGSWSAGDRQDAETSPENGGPFSSEVVDPGPSDLLVNTPPFSIDAVPPLNPRSELLPIALMSVSPLNLPVTATQPRVPRIRLGTSALYCRPDCRTVDLYRSAEFPASANHLRPFSPLSAVGYAEAADGLSHPYQQIPEDEFPFIHSPHGYGTSVGWQPPVSESQPGDMYGRRRQLEPRSQPRGVHSTPLRNFHPSAGQYFVNDLSLTEDQFNDMLSNSDDSDNVDMVSPLFDDDITGSIII